MKYVIGILLALVAISAAYYFLVWIPEQGDNGDGTKKCPDGSVIPTSESCPRTTEGNVDPCINVKCKNGGTCNGGVCNCPKGYTGSDCGAIDTSIVSLPDQSLAFRSTQVNAGDVSNAQSPSSLYLNVPYNSLSGYNVLSSPSETKLIHYKVNNIACPQYVWYKSSLYSKRGEETNPANGVKTCYYGIDKSAFPAEIKIRIPVWAGDCSLLNSIYFISGISYIYNRTTIEGQGTMTYHACIFKKQ